jgi:hypothetical protein
MGMRWILLSCVIVCGAWGDVVSGQPARPTPFAIEVVDEQTGRGVPLVELRTVSNVAYYTDSAGLAAVDDPALFGQTAFFRVSSHGYEMAADGFGMRGRRLEVKPGGSAQIKIKRLNVAERLYRVTGEGIYRDSAILGRPVPIRRGLLNAQVTGQDSAQVAVYRDKLYWFWGDTNRISYPLGHFGTSAATSLLPGKGGLDPAVGVDLEYFTDGEGFSRPVFEVKDNHPVWLDGLFVLKDGKGVERLVGKSSEMKSLRETVARRLVVFNDDKDRFDTLKDIPLDVPLYPQGHPLRVEVDGKPYIYCGNVFPNVRFKADWESFQDVSGYESFTCLVPSSRVERGAEPMLERDAAGKLVWGWKRDTAALGTRDLIRLLDDKKVPGDGAWPLTLDMETKQPVTLVLQSVHFNAYRKRYVGIGVQMGGKASYFGEIYYAEADRPEGPWPWARKVVTHDRYSLYNPVQHPYFEREGGRVIYFEGTYVTTFSRPDADATPRYDYNQVMYRLDLSDPRLALPVAEERPGR